MRWKNPMPDLDKWYQFRAIIPHLCASCDHYFWREEGWACWVGYRDSMWRQFRCGVCGPGNG